MTDEELVAKKLARIETSVQGLRRHTDVDRLETDPVMQGFVLHTLQLAIQAVLDVASHIVSDDRLGEPRTNRELFSLLVSNGWIPESALAHLQNMAGFRNVLVHAYDTVDFAIVREVLDHRLDDLLTFAETIRNRLAEPT